MRKAAITLKGKAFLAAIDAGLVKEGVFGANAGPFLRFWDALLVLLEEFSAEGNNLMDMLKEESNDSTQD